MLLALAHTPPAPSDQKRVYLLAILNTQTVVSFEITVDTREIIFTPNLCC